MARLLAQTDNAPENAFAIISPFTTVVSDQFLRLLQVGGTAGVSSVAVQVASGEPGDTWGRVHFRTADGDPGAADDWAAGDWTVRFEVTTANMFLTWDGLGIAAVNAAETAHTTIASATSLGISCGSTGVKSTTVSGVSPGTDRDHIQVSCGITNSQAMANTMDITPSQIIDSPFSSAPKPAAPLTLDRRRRRNPLTIR